MRLERAVDAVFVNRVANDPAVRPHLLGGATPIDYTALVADTGNVILQSAHGAMVFHKRMPGFYEVHTQVLSEGRGKWTLEMAHSALLWMFTRTDAVEIMTRVPHGNEPARQLTLALGGALEQNVQAELDGLRVIWGIYRLVMQDWIKTCPYLEAMGELFHVKLHGEYARLGLDIERHDQDAWHDRNAGMAYLMVTGGQPHKGVGFYNRWAMMALAPPIALVSLNPLVIDIRDCLLKVVGEDFEVLEART